jgi:hypothetical protein
MRRFILLISGMGLWSKGVAVGAVAAHRRPELRTSNLTSQYLAQWLSAMVPEVSNLWGYATSKESEPIHIRSLGFSPDMSSMPVHLHPDLLYKL